MGNEFDSAIISVVYCTFLYFSLFAIVFVFAPTSTRLSSVFIYLFFELLIESLHSSLKVT